MSAWHVRVFRRFHVAPGLTINLSNSGLSASVGVRGLHATFNRRGVRKTIGLPGSGLRVTRFDPYDHPPTLAGYSEVPHPHGWLWLICIVLVAADVIAYMGAR